MLATHFQIDDTVCVFNDSRSVRCEEVFDFLILERLKLRSTFGPWNQGHFTLTMRAMFY